MDSNWAYFFLVFETYFASLTGNGSEVNARRGRLAHLTLKSLENLRHCWIIWRFFKLKKKCVASENVTLKTIVSFKCWSNITDIRLKTLQHVT
jgi:hypothetical protein